MYKTWAFSWEPEVTDAFFTTSCSQHNKSGRRTRLKKWKAIFILILQSKKDLSTSCSNFMWGRVHLGELQTSCLKVFIPYSFLIKKCINYCCSHHFNKTRWNDCILNTVSTFFCYSCLGERHYFSSMRKAKWSYVVYKFHPAKFLFT